MTSHWALRFDDTIPHFLVAWVLLSARCFFRGPYHLPITGFIFLSLASTVIVIASVGLLGQGVEIELFQPGLGILEGTRKAIPFLFLFMPSFLFLLLLLCLVLSCLHQPDRHPLRGCGLVYHHYRFRWLPRVHGHENIGETDAEDTRNKGVIRNLGEGNRERDTRTDQMKDWWSRIPSRFRLRSFNAVQLKETRIIYT